MASFQRKQYVFVISSLESAEQFRITQLVPQQVRPNYGIWVFTYIPSLGDYKLDIINYPCYKIGFRVHTLALLIR